MASVALQRFNAFETTIFADGALSAKTKQLIAFAAAHMTESDTCVAGHAGKALKLGATREELKEAMWVAIVMRAGAGLRGGGGGAEAMIDRMAQVTQAPKA